MSLPDVLHDVRCFSVMLSLCFHLYAYYNAMIIRCSKCMGNMF